MSRWVWVVGGAAVLAFAYLVWRGAAGDFLAAENRLLVLLRDSSDPGRGIGPWWMEGVMRDLTGLGSTVVLTLTTIGVVGYLCLRRSWFAAGLVAASAGGGAVLVVGLKSLFSRPRPSVVPHLATEVSASFPSGHSMMASVVYLTLAVLLGQLVVRRRERVYFIAIGLFVVALVGVSRVYLGVHYPTDVLAGWSAGIAWALLCWVVAVNLQRRRAVETPPRG
ncbi:phosphatase PAP2 family protein [Synoicihabitans lomoniglobus]|uniref:phosphatase PAP2 family protein n=1 Tax=Synoicihabitans lomoniglobus TaxID=2909285 RepID=UPI002ED17EA7|nr:phosphatase PAP2 family protein [Opitutaceae bacterium LMO-M01]